MRSALALFALLAAPLLLPLLLVSLAPAADAQATIDDYAPRRTLPPGARPLKISVYFEVRLRRRSPRARRAAHRGRMRASACAVVSRAAGANDRSSRCSK